MRFATPLTLALLLVAGAASAAGQTATTDPAKKDTPAQTTAPSGAPAAPAMAGKDTDKIPQRAATAERPRHIHRVRSGRRVKVRRRSGGWKWVWVYRAHDRHGDRHYHLRLRKFGGYFAPGKVRVGAYVLPRRQGCDCWHLPSRDRHY